MEAQAALTRLLDKWHSYPLGQGEARKNTTLWGAHHRLGGRQEQQFQKSSSAGQLIPNNISMLWQLEMPATYYDHDTETFA